MATRRLPNPVTTDEEYLAAILEQVAVMAEAITAIAGAMTVPTGAEPVDQDQLKSSLMEIKGIGPATADEILRRLLNKGDA